MFKHTTKVEKIVKYIKAQIIIGTFTHFQQLSKHSQFCYLFVTTLISHGIILKQIPDMSFHP